MPTIFRYISPRVATFVLALCLLMPLSLSAQEAEGGIEGGEGSSSSTPQLNISLAPDTILIGDRATLSVEVEKDFMQVVNLPQFENNLIGDAIEVLGVLPVDTVVTDTRRHKITWNYLLTSFEPGTYNLSNFPALYLDKNIVDTLHAPQQIVLTVGSLSVDTLSTTIYDIKAPIETPLVVGEFRGYLELFFIVGLILAAIIILVANRPRKTRERELDKRPTEPPHLRAIRELEALHSQKIWQNNKHKLYYTRLTEILRDYLDGRYGIGAKEMTTDEIVEAIAPLALSEKNRADLRSTLSLADFVKFAKHIPTAEENEEAYYKVYYFVEETKEQAEQVAGEPEKMVVNITHATNNSKEREE